MKIGKTPEQANTAAIANAAEKARAAAPAATTDHLTTAAADEASSKVALSTTATSLIRTTDNNADFDADKVATVSHAIDNGSYKVNAHTIADKLLANARELLTKTAQ